MSTKEGERGTVAAIPGSVTDLAKGLRELIACLRDIATLFDDGRKRVVDHGRSRRSLGAARNLDTLVFSPLGSRQFLERIAEGTGTADDVGGVKKLLDTTAEEVQRSMQELGTYRDTLRENCGMAAAQMLDEIIYGRFGKDGLRRSLARIVEISHLQDPVPQEAVQIASDALKIIADLNARIGELHDQMLEKIKTR